MPFETDAQLIEACVRRDSEAWRLLVQRYEGLVYQVLRKQGVAPADQPDVFQTVFIRILNSLQQLRDPARLTAWIVITTRRESWRAVEKRRATAAIAGEFDVADPDASVDDIEQWERQQAVQRGLRTIGDRCRRLLQALYFADPPLSYDAVARELGVAIGSIGPTRARCFEKLTAALKADGFI
jgi:RNA polymerase sigma factor (sigma-70 family)